MGPRGDIINDGSGEAGFAGGTWPLDRPVTDSDGLLTATAVAVEGGDSLPFGGVVVNAGEDAVGTAEGRRWRAGPEFDTLRDLVAELDDEGAFAVVAVIMILSLLGGAAVLADASASGLWPH